MIETGSIKLSLYNYVVGMYMPARWLLAGALVAFLHTTVTTVYKDTNNNLFIY